MLTKEEKLNQRKLEAIIKAHQNKQKELKLVAKTGSNCEAYYSQKSINKRMTYGHPKDFDLNYTKKVKNKVFKYIHVKKLKRRTIEVFHCEK